MVISNCVINLSPDKPRVFREVLRVLKPGGKMIVSDIVLNRPLPERIADDPNLYSACIAGALLREDYLGAIRAAGFAEVEVLSDKTYSTKQIGGDPITAESAPSWTAWPPASRSWRGKGFEHGWHGHALPLRDHVMILTVPARKVP